MKEVTVRLTDQDAYANYPFPYQINQRVRLRIDGREGIVRNATFVGADLPCGNCKMTYVIKVDDGRLIQIPPDALMKANTASAYLL